jgi:tRNA(Ile2) C34 agmatinyltransferase TiaS
MSRFPRGSLPPKEFLAIASSPPLAIERREANTERACVPHDLDTVCPQCQTQMRPEHAHYRCPACGYRDSCCF